MSWSRNGKFDSCQKCGTTERKHMALGFCERCYNTYRYALNIDKEHARRKAKRLAEGTVEQRYSKVRAWVEANRDRNAAVKKAWHAARVKWPVGLKVWFWWKGFWRSGSITAKRGKVVTVTVPGLVEQLLGVRRLYLIRKDIPAALDRGPKMPPKAKRNEGWSRDWDCCQECKTTWIPYSCNGLCKKCYERNRSIRRREAKRSLQLVENEQRRAS